MENSASDVDAIAAARRYCNKKLGTSRCNKEQRPRIFKACVRQRGPMDQDSMARARTLSSLLVFEGSSTSDTRVKRGLVRTYTAICKIREESTKSKALEHAHGAAGLRRRLWRGRCRG